MKRARFQRNLVASSRNSMIHRLVARVLLSCAIVVFPQLRITGEHNKRNEPDASEEKVHDCATDSEIRISEATAGHRDEDNDCDDRLARS
jgi:hypothetical protein